MQELVDEANFAYGGKNDWQVRLQDHSSNGSLWVCGVEGEASSECQQNTL